MGFTGLCVPAGARLYQGPKRPGLSIALRTEPPEAQSKLEGFSGRIYADERVSPG